MKQIESLAWSAGLLAATLLTVPAFTVPALQAQTGGGSPSGQTAAQTGGAAQTTPVPLDKLVTATCRQAWLMSGRNRDQFFEYVKELAALSAQNRNVSLPDDQASDAQAAGARAGQWIRTQAIKDPDQLLYAVVDHAVRYSISKGRATPNAGGTAAPTPPSQ